MRGGPPAAGNEALSGNRRTAPTPVLSIRLPEARVPTFSAFLAAFQQDVGGWSETTGRGLSGSSRSAGRKDPGWANTRHLTPPRHRR